MCHMQEKYRVWHDRCHMDDAKMSPTDDNHIDGYAQARRLSPASVRSNRSTGYQQAAGTTPATPTCASSPKRATEGSTLTLISETRDADIRQPDGQSDVLQQCENGAFDPRDLSQDRPPVPRAIVSDPRDARALRRRPIGRRPLAAHGGQSRALRAAHRGHGAPSAAQQRAPRGHSTRLSSSPTRPPSRPSR
jgi:hypothetical protein